jgi:hypothetical protein
MKFILIWLAMMFFHVVDDFHLQGVLAQMKQKDWWREHYDNSLYKEDYITALQAHAFSWTFMIHIPLFAAMLYWGIMPNVWIFLAIFWGNFIIHAVTDDLKANVKVINLKTDQAIHWAQVLLTIVLYAWLVF